MLVHETGGKMERCSSKPSAKQSYWSNGKFWQHRAEDTGKGKWNFTEGKPFSMPEQNRPTKKTKVDEFYKCVICGAINEFNVTEGQRQTLKALL